jgi:hypothetical protein
VYFREAYSIQSVHTQRYLDTTLTWLDCKSSSEDHSTPDHSLHGAPRNISAVVSTFQHFIGGFSYILTAVLIHIQLCDCGTHYEPFQKCCSITTVKTPGQWHPQSVTTCRRRFCASVVYILHGMCGCLYMLISTLCTVHAVLK